MHEAFFHGLCPNRLCSRFRKKATYHLVLRKPPCSSEKLFLGASSIISRVINFGEETVAEKCFPFELLAIIVMITYTLRNYVDDDDLIG